MRRLLEEIKSGDFLDKARIRRIAVIYFVVSIVAFSFLLATSKNGIDYRCRPISADYFAFWSAARVATENGAATAYDHLANREFQIAYPGNCSEAFLPFWSPPQFLLALIPFSALPYTLSWIAFCGLSLAAYTGATRRLLTPRAPALPILAAPGAMSNFLIGQIGLVLAGLLSAALACLEKRPWLAGVLFGFMAIKPQYGVLIPLFLLLTGNWRAFLAATICVAAQIAAAAMAFGPEIWLTFAKNLATAKALMLDSTAIASEKYISVFAMVRTWGGGNQLAYGAQIVAAAIIMLIVIRFWRSNSNQRLKAAATPVATLMISPYALDYDLVLLLPAAALFIDYALERGFRPYEKSLLLLVWLSPVIAYPITLGAKFPVGLLVSAALLAMITRQRTTQ